MDFTAAVVPSRSTCRRGACYSELFMPFQWCLLVVVSAPTHTLYDWGPSDPSHIPEVQNFSKHICSPSPHFSFDSRFIYLLLYQPCLMLLASDQFVNTMLVSKFMGYLLITFQDLGQTFSSGKYHPTHFINL